MFHELKNNFPIVLSLSQLHLMGGAGIAVCLMVITTLEQAECPIVGSHAAFGLQMCIWFFVNLDDSVVDPCQISSFLFFFVLFLDA